jgi:aminopeptidase N
MKKGFLILFSFITLFINSQEHQCARNKQITAAGLIKHQAKMALLSPQISHEMEYDVKFVHLNLKLNRYNKYVAGNVKTVATVTSTALDTFMTFLHLNLSIDSARFNGQLVNFIRQDSMVKIKTPSTLSNGSSFTATIHYKGTPPSGGAAIGSGFSNGTSGASGNRVTWSLSESFVAYHWWPCKQILTDKIDSSWVFITTDSLNKAGSNGVLTNVVTVDSLKRFEWKSRTPIDYYLISIAVAKYKEYNLYAKPQYLPNDSILIQNYIYDVALNSPTFAAQKAELNKMPGVLEFLSNMYGMYPFYKEKYGHCMAPFSGGMEHQTMTTLGFFDYYINAHELGHQWWGDNVTCKSWGDIFINEAFATYTELLVAQYLDNQNFASNLSSSHNYVMSQPGGSCFFTGQDTLNTSRIFNSRLTYEKGGDIIHSLRFLTNNDSLWFNTLRGFQNTYKNSTASVVDFKNYYQAQTGINATQFFNQWFYGEGYPTFNVKYNHLNNVLYIQNTQTVSMASATPLFITPLEYSIKRIGKPDTTLRLMHNLAVENYSIALTGTIIAISVDPNNWLINKTNGPTKDATLGVENTSNIEAIAANENSFSISPNPSVGLFTIKGPQDMKGYVEAYSLNGKKVLYKKMGPDTTIDLSHYPEGVYMLRIFNPDGEEQYSQKIIRH